jgi:hypothetical protein
MSESSVVFETIKNITNMIDTGTEKGVLTLAIRGASQAKLLAPVNKIKGIGGQLQNSIQYVTGTGFKGGLNDSPGDNADKTLTEPLKSNEAAIGATADYAGYVEYGTRNQAPQVYMRSSLALIAGVAPSVVKEKMDAEFKLGKLKYGQTRTKF